MPDETVDTRQSQPRHGKAVLLSPSAPFVGQALLAVLLLMLPACAGPTVRNADRPRQGPVVVLGDSLGAGYGVARGEGFVELLGSRLEIEMVNLSQSGITTERSRPRVASEVLPLNPSLVILQLGGNDALRKVPLAQTRNHLAAMIEELQAAGLPVIVLGVRGGVLSDAYEGLFEGLVEEYKTGYVSDILQGILTRADMKVDHIHPNAQGHLRIAERVEPELRRVWSLLGGD